MAERIVVDASAMVELLVGTSLAAPVRDQLRGSRLAAPAHFDAEILSALGRLHRGGHLSERETATRLRWLVDAPVTRHELAPLVTGAWRLRHDLRLVDALYVELAAQLDAPLVTTDARLATASSNAVLVGPGRGSG